MFSCPTRPLVNVVSFIALVRLVVVTSRLTVFTIFSGPTFAFLYLTGFTPVRDIFEPPRVSWRPVGLSQTSTVVA